MTVLRNVTLGPMKALGVSRDQPQAAAPSEPRTQQFLQRIIAAGRL
jgi:hypothetical protein